MRREVDTTEAPRWRDKYRRDRRLTVPVSRSDSQCSPVRASSRILPQSERAPKDQAGQEVHSGSTRHDRRWQIPSASLHWPGSEIIRWPKNSNYPRYKARKYEFERKSRSTTSCDLKHSDSARQCIAVAQRCPDITEGCGNSGEVRPQHLVSKSKRSGNPLRSGFAWQGELNACACAGPGRRPYAPSVVLDD